MPSILVTAAVFQAEMSWLKAPAFPNMLSILVTFAVFQAEMSWLKAAVFANMPSSGMKMGGIAMNMPSIVVTCDVSHDPIAIPFPCMQFTDGDEQLHAPVASAARQLLTAVLRSTPSAGKGAARARSGAIEIATSAPTSAATRA